MRFKINPFFFVVWGAFLLLEKSSFVLYIFLCAAIHEAAHICSFFIFGAEVSKIEILPFGISAVFSDTARVSYKNEIICMLIGPFANLATSGLCFLALRFLEKPPFGLDFMIACNLAFAIINLLPIYPLDGGRALNCFLKNKLPEQQAINISLLLSYIFLIPLFICGAALLVYTGYNFSLLLIFMYLLLYLLIKKNF